MKPLLLSLGVLIAMTPCYGNTKPETHPQRIQQDITRDCIVVRNIVFGKGRISGAITNSCGKEVFVFMVLEFCDRSNNKTDAVLEVVSKGSDTAFWSGPDGRELSAFCATTGRITVVIPRSEPPSSSRPARLRGLRSSNVRLQCS